MVTTSLNNKLGSNDSRDLCNPGQKWIVSTCRGQSPFPRDSISWKSDRPWRTKRRVTNDATVFSSCRVLKRRRWNLSGGNCAARQGNESSVIYVGSVETGWQSHVAGGFNFLWNFFPLLPPRSRGNAVREKRGSSSKYHSGRCPTGHVHSESAFLLRCNQNAVGRSIGPNRANRTLRSDNGRPSRACETVLRHTPASR